jgi:chemosensory pili system protein ChpA (sensor histidine kinase/response regulator)
MAGTTDQGILHTFLGEVRGHMPALEREAARLREGGAGHDALAEVRRLAHTIRGASEMVGLLQLAAAARGVENLAVSQNMDGSIEAEAMERLEQSIGSMRDELGGLEGGVAGTAPADRATENNRDEVDEEIFRAFSTEAEQLLDSIRSQLGKLTGPGSAAAAAMEALRHAVHTLKGAAGMAGLGSVSGLAHRMEDVLGLIESGRLPAEPEIVEILVSAHDLLGDLVAARGLSGPLQEPFEAVKDQFDLLESLAAESAAAPIPAPEDAGFAEVEETDDTLIETFLGEAEAHMLSAGDAFRALAAEPGGPEHLLSALRRSAHTIKGAAGMVGLMAASRLAKGMQTLLDRVSERAVSYSPAVYQLLGDGFDLLADVIEARGQNGPLIERLITVSSRLEESVSGPRQAAELAAATDAGSEKGEPAAAKAGGLAPVAIAASDSGQQMVRVPMDRLAGVSRLVGEVFLNASAFEQQVSAFKREMDELSLNLSRMRRISAALAEEQVAEGDARPAGTAHASASAAEFDVLEFDRYSRLHLLSRDLAEATNDLSALSTQLNNMRAQLDSWAGRQRGLSGEAQDKLMRMRLVPLSTLANRLSRTVRASAAKTGKQAALTLVGMETEFDKAVSEQLSGPLEHLLRNAVDHGLEAPEARIAAGKPPVGCIRLEASHQGAHLIIRLSDDGAGIDHEKIRRQGVKLGWLTEEQAAALGREELERLILEPGFSTADSLSEISGRGVGMEIVAASVAALRGRLSVQSTAGEGTEFTLRLPVSLAVAKTMIVEAAGNRFALPMAAFTRALRVQNEELEVRDGQPGIELADGWIPVVHLATRLGIAESMEASDRFTLLFVDNGEREIAVAVDRVVEAREVVVKPLSKLLRRQTNFTGATILGDGSVVLILNSSAIDVSAAERPLAAAGRVQKPADRLTVLVVDDSISVRRSVANLMKSAGWRVVTARDGLEGLEHLQDSSKRPDLVLMDIEMPRMDGYELASRMRSSPEFDGVPILMLTSRAGEKHRLKADGIGVDGYLVKPCPDDVLLETVSRCMAGGRRSRMAS